MIRFISITLLLCLGFQAQAQLYENAAGLRGGLGATATYKHFIGTDWAIEGTLGLFENDLTGISITFQNHKDLEDVENVKWYWAIGGFYAFKDEINAVGLSSGLGLEWALQSIPLTFSLDWQPRLRLNEMWRLYSTEGGLAIRYIINY